MAKKFYAGSHHLGKNFSYDAGWSVFVFKSKQARDKFVSENGEKREAISRDIAKKIAGSNVKESWNEAGDMAILEQANDYYNANYWG